MPGMDDLLKENDENFKKWAENKEKISGVKTTSIVFDGKKEITPDEFYKLAVDAERYIDKHQDDSAFKMVLLLVIIALVGYFMYATF
jgi:hypothetical protein